MAFLLSCENLGKTFGARSLFEGVGLSIDERDRVGLIGPNGSGKSTLLKILCGRESADLIGSADGPRIVVRKNLRLGYVPQQEAFDADKTALRVVTEALADDMGDEHEHEVRAAVALDKAGLDPDQPAGAMSGGWRKRLAITRQLAREPDLLLLDEPTNHLDLRGIEWLEDVLANPSFAAVVVTHDRYFLERAVTRIVDLNRAYPSGTLAADGPYSTFLRRRADFLQAQVQQQQGLASKVREDLEWLRRGAKARRTKSKSRIDASQQRMQDLADLASRNAPARAADIAFAASGRATRKLLTAEGLTKSLGGRALFHGLDLTLSPGACVGLLGANGSGKTTLIRVLTGQLAPDAGTIQRADGLRSVVFTQAREQLDPRQSLREALCPLGDFVEFGGRQVHVNTWAKRFLFRSEQLRVSVGDLSGGEQARILMARLMLRPADLLILDEPTNDLDIESLEVLEQSVADFPGAVVLVTHDRFMLDRLSTMILALDGEGGARFYADLAQWQDAQDDARAAPKREAPASGKPEAVAAAAPGRLKLSFNEQRELDRMEATIIAAEADAARLEAAVADPAILADHVKLNDHYHRLGTAHTRVTELYRRWEELESRGG